MILAYTAARAGAVARLRRMDYLTVGRSWWFNFEENAASRATSRHDLQAQMETYLHAASLEGRSYKMP